MITSAPAGPATPPATAHTAAPATFVFDPNVACTLVGTKLKDDWVLTKKLAHPTAAGGTGGNFSVGYVAEQRGDKGQVIRDAFVKVFDLGQAFRVHSGDIMTAITQLGIEHAHETRMCEICDAARLTRVVKVLGRDQIVVSSGPGGFPTPLPYIIFELGDADLRATVRKLDAADAAWRLRMLHNVAAGLQEIHSQSIAHQDLKPSNVMIFEKTRQGAKLADLGRASRDDGRIANHDDFSIAGDSRYAPPEQCYGVRATEWRDRREGCDLYHLGCLIAFSFSGTTPNQRYPELLPDAIRPEVWALGKWRGTYEEVLPHVIKAFTTYLEEIKPHFPDWAAEEMTGMVQNLCNPEYLKRGYPGVRIDPKAPFGLDRFLSRLDHLANKAKVTAKS